MKNEKGFTLVEGLLSLSTILLLCSTLFPLIFLMINKLQAEKLELWSYRILYEYIEQYPNLEGPLEIVRNNRGIDFTIVIKDGRACIFYEKEENCVSS